MKCASCGQIHSQSHEKYVIVEQSIRQRFKSLKFPELQETEKKMNEEIQSLQEQKINIQAALSSEEINSEEYEQLITQFDGLIKKYRADFKEFVEQQFQKFRQAVINQLKKVNEDNQKALKIKAQLIPIFASQKIFSSPKEQFQNAQNATWMKKPFDMKTIILQKNAQKPLDISISQNTKITIKQVLDSNGKSFQGKMVIKSHACDSIKQPQRLKSLPPLLMFDPNNPGSGPTGKLVSFSMLANRFQDEKGKLLFPTEPIKVVQKVSCQMSCETLQKFKAWKWDDFQEGWIQTGQLQVSADGKEIKYEIVPKTKQEMIRMLLSIGTRRKSAQKQLVFNAEEIRKIAITLKQASTAHAIEIEQENIKHQILVQEHNKKIDANVSMQGVEKLTLYSNALNYMTQEIKSSKSSLLYEKIAQHFINKQDLVSSESDDMKSQLIFIPKHLRGLSKEYLYQSMVNLNKKSFNYTQQKTFIRSEQYLSYLKNNKLEQIVEFLPLKQTDIKMIKSVVIESPRQRFCQKYIFIHSNMRFFQDNTFMKTISKLFNKQFSLELINKQVDVSNIINKINQDTILNLRRKLQKWQQIKMKPQQKDHQKSEQLYFKKEQVNSHKQYPLHQIYEEDNMTIADLLVNSKLQNIKLISTNKYLIKLQIAVLFSLTKDMLIKFEENIRYKNSDVSKLKNQIQGIKTQIGPLPELSPLKPKFLEQYTEYFKVLAEQNEQTINQIIETQFINSLQLPQQYLMQQIENPDAKQFIIETEKVFNRAQLNGLLDPETVNSIKQQKVNQIKKQYLLIQHWNSNKLLIQRIIKEIFPDFSFLSQDYDQLIQNLRNYYETRSVLSSKEDIEKFKVNFVKKYKFYQSKQEKGLPGGNPGMRADYFKQKIKKQYGPQAAAQAMNTIGNVDCLTTLSQKQMEQFTQKAKRFTVLKNKEESDKKIADYAKNVNQMKKAQPLVQNSNSKSQSQKAMDNIDKDQKENKKAYEDNLGISDSKNKQNPLKENNPKLNQVIKDKLSNESKLKNPSEENDQQTNKGPIKRSDISQVVGKALDDLQKASTNQSIDLDQINQQIEDLQKKQQNSQSYQSQKEQVTKKFSKTARDFKSKLKQSKLIIKNNSTSQNDQKIAEQAANLITSSNFKKNLQEDIKLC